MMTSEKTGAAPAAPMSLASVRLCSTENAEIRTLQHFDQLQVLPDRSLVWYSSRVNKKKRNEQQMENLNKRGQYNGKMSRATRSKLKKILLNWMQALQFHLDENNRNRKKCKYFPVFVTLTLSDKQRHSDNWIKRKYLNNFISDIKRNHGIENYYWKAEAQKNGNIHFHLIVDRYIQKEILQQKWNRIQSEYVDSYTKRTGKINPPSTQIEGIRNYKRISMYATKYGLKEAEDYAPRKIEGRIWGCSDQLRCVQAFTLSNLEDERKTIESELTKIDQLSVENYAVDESYVYVKLSIDGWDRLKNLQASLQDHYAEQYRMLYKDKEYDDYKRSLVLISARKELIRRQLENDKAIKRANRAVQKWSEKKGIQKPVRYIKSNRLSDIKLATLRQVVE